MYVDFHRVVQDSKDQPALSFAHTTAHAWLKNQDSSKDERNGSLVNTLTRLLGDCQILAAEFSNLEKFC